MRPEPQSLETLVRILSFWTLRSPYTVSFHRLRRRSERLLFASGAQSAVRRLNDNDRRIRYRVPVDFAPSERYLHQRRPRHDNATRRALSPLRARASRRRSSPVIASVASRTVPLKESISHRFPGRCRKTQGIYRTCVTHLQSAWRFAGKLDSRECTAQCRCSARFFAHREPDGR